MLQAMVGALLFLGLALLILLNSSFTTSINLFGKVYEQVPVIMVILISFFAGVCYTLLFYLYSRVRKFSRNRRKQKQEKLEESTNIALKAQKDQPGEPQLPP